MEHNGGGGGQYSVNCLPTGLSIVWLKREWYVHFIDRHNSFSSAQGGLVLSYIL